LVSIIPTQILDFCKQHQIGRVGEKTTVVGFDSKNRWYKDKNDNVSVLQPTFSQAISQKLGMNKSLGYNVTDTMSPTFVQDTAKLFPETKQGTFKGNQHIELNEIISFTKDTYGYFGIL